MFIKAALDQILDYWTKKNRKVSSQVKSVICVRKISDNGDSVCRCIIKVRNPGVVNAQIWVFRHGWVFVMSWMESYNMLITTATSRMVNLRFLESIWTPMGGQMPSSSSTDSRPLLKQPYPTHLFVFESLFESSSPIA